MADVSPPLFLFVRRSPSLSPRFHCIFEFTSDVLNCAFLDDEAIRACTVVIAVVSSVVQGP